VLIAFLDEPHRPVFGDFVFSSPSARDKTRHSQAAQVAHNTKLAEYSKHHDFPTNVFFPLAAERSGYLHPAFTNFIELFIARVANAPPRAAHKLQLLYSIAHAITYITASFLRSASFQLTPSSVKSLMPPPPLVTPVRWAPKLRLHSRRHNSSSGAPSLPNGAQRRRADTLLPESPPPAPSVRSVPNGVLPVSPPPAPSERLGQGAVPHANEGQLIAPVQWLRPLATVLRDGLAN
jgi:hypothetical protein